MDKFQQYSDTVRSDSEDEQTIEKDQATQSYKQVPHTEEGLTREARLDAFRKEEAPIITDHMG